MKRFISQALWVASAVAFPAAVWEALEKGDIDPDVVARATKFLNERQTPNAGAATAVFEPAPVFNAKAQLINVGSGSGHEWVAPTGTDLRGPCPGLNAFANHGFLPHDGYATITQFITACTEVVGMGPDLAAFLAALGGVLDGDVTAWSIAGTPTVAQAGVLGNQGNGISGSHNKYESDASPTRCDLYQCGNDYKVVNQQFNQLISACPGGTVDMTCLTNFRSQRFDTQVSVNKYFFNGPFTGVLVQPAAYTFIFRFMANHTEAAPTGVLTYSTLASWFGMSGSTGNYVAKQGYERIPNNWYRRALVYPYTNEYFLADVLNAALIYPKFLDIGGNTGTTNSFTGVNVTDLTAGVYNAQTLTQGDNFACLAFQFAAQAKPDIAANALTAATSQVAKLTSALSCPQLESIDQSQLEKFPGYTKSDVDYNL